MLIAMAGLPASGKSTIAQKLATTLDAVLLDKDDVRAFLFRSTVDYEREQDDLCVNVMYDVACYHLARRPETPVILDGRSYSRAYQVAAVKAVAKRANVALVIVECVCSPETARSRLQSDKGIHPAGNRNYAMYQKSRATAESINEPRLIIDTDTHDAGKGAQLAISHIKKLQICQ